MPSPLASREEAGAPRGGGEGPSERDVDTTPDPGVRRSRLGGAPAARTDASNGSEAEETAGHEHERRARLSVVRQDGSIGETYWIDAPAVDIGRDAVGIQLASDRFVSPRHARILREADDYYLCDLESVNGVFLRLRGESPLIHGDRVLLGSELLKFELLDATELGVARSSREDTDIYGSSERPWYARLTQQTVEGVARNAYILFAEETVVGRETGDIVFTSDSFMSRRHALFRRDPSAGGFTLRDLGSSNGSYLGIRGKVPLTKGDHIRVGQHLFRFGLGS